MGELHFTSQAAPQLKQLEKTGLKLFLVLLHVLIMSGKKLQQNCN
tara:strand:+ start:23771 stop:23905 length:135 start_codon:yes stop_codon:yes gene_type:complete